MVFRRVTDKSLLLATRFGSQGVRILSAMVLARLVAKEDFGRFELILSVPGIISAAGDFGVTRSVTTSHDLPDDKVQDTGLIILVLMSLIFAALAIAAGWYYSRAGADPRLFWVGCIVAATFVVQNVQASQMAMLARELRFARWAGVEALMMLATIATGIGVAVAGGGIFALALQQLLAQVFGLIVTAHARPLRWPTSWDRGIARRFFSFGWKISLFQWTNNVQGSLGRQAIAQIGPMAGAVAVGTFGRATQVRDLIGHNLATTFDLVLMPLFSRAKDDPPRLRDLLIRGSVGVTVFCAFGAAWLAAVAPDLIRVVLGRNWSEVPDLLRALAPGLAIQGLAYPCVILSLAMNQPLVTFRYALINMIGLGFSVLALWHWGLWHFAASQSLFSIVPALYGMWWGTHATGMSLRDLIRRLAPILFEAGLVCAAMLAVNLGFRWLTNQWPGMNKPIIGGWLNMEQIAAVACLLVASFAGGLIGWLLLAKWDRHNYDDLVGLLFRRKPDEEITAADLAVEP